jgi:hypothetical protein
LTRWPESLHPSPCWLLNRCSSIWHPFIEASYRDSLTPRKHTPIYTT